MVRKVAVPARSSVVKVVLRSLSLNRFPIRDFPMKVLRRVNGDGFGCECPSASISDELVELKVCIGIVHRK